MYNSTDNIKADTKLNFRGVKNKTEVRTRRQIRQAENKRLRSKSLFGWSIKYYEGQKDNIPWLRIWGCYFKVKRSGRISFDFFEDPYTSKLVYKLIEKEIVSDNEN